MTLYLSCIICVFAKLHSSPVALTVCLDSQDACTEWMKPFFSVFQHSPEVQMYHMSIVANRLLGGLLGSWLSKRLKQQIPIERHRTHLQVLADPFPEEIMVKEEREKKIAEEGTSGPLRIHNKLVAHLMLIDRHGRIRWRATGTPKRSPTGVISEIVPSVDNSSPSTTSTSSTPAKPSDRFTNASSQPPSARFFPSASTSGIPQLPSVQLVKDLSQLSDVDVVLQLTEQLRRER